jgi:hypothetical protein
MQCAANLVHALIRAKVVDYGNNYFFHAGWTAKIDILHHRDVYFTHDRHPGKSRLSAYWSE